MSFQNRHKNIRLSIKRRRLMANIIFAIVAIIFLAMIVLTVIAGIGIVQIAEDPAAIGSYVGEIVNGFNETAQ